MLVRLGILTDVEPDSGLGHAKRVLALTSSFAKIGIEVNIFISKKSKKEFIQNKNNVTQINFKNVQEDLIQELNTKNIQLLIIDTYLLDKSQIIDLVENFPNLPILAFDDYGEKKSWPITGFINTGLGHSLISYPGRAKIYSAFGISYYPISEELAKFNLYRHKEEKKSQLLLVMGGGDPERQTIRLIRILIDLKIQLTLQIKVVLGPFYEDCEEIIEITKDFPGQIEVIINPENFYQHLIDSNVVVSGCGTIVYELIYLRVNFAALALSKNQIPTLNNLTNHGISLGYFSDVSDKDIALKIEKLLHCSQKKINYDRAPYAGGELIGEKSLAERVIEIYSRIKGFYFSTEDTINDYKMSFDSFENYKKVKWSSEASMINQFALGLGLIRSANSKNWLDVGCGTGDILRFSKIFDSPPKKYTGLDISEELLSYAEDNFSLNDGSIKFINQNFMAKVSGEPFDLITSFGVLQKCGIELNEAVGRLSGLLSKKGILLISTKNLDWSAFDDPSCEPYSGHCWFSINQLKAAFHNARLKIISIQGFDATKNLYLNSKSSHSIFILGEKI